MCVLAFAWRAHPRWPLVVAGNRDELHARSAEPLHRWKQPDHLLAGRDLQSGGTWLGVSERGRFAVVTNLRGYGMPATDRTSRGMLLTSLLSGEASHADPGEAELSQFNPFNLIVADRKRAQFMSNRPATVQSLAPGLYGLANGALDEPSPKVLRLKARVREWMAKGAARPDALLDDLRDESLPDVGVRSAVRADAPQEPPLSPIFIRNRVFGTRCSTVLAIDHQSNGIIFERRYSPDGEAVGETALSFSWPAWRGCPA